MLRVNTLLFMPSFFLSSYFSFLIMINKTTYQVYAAKELFNREWRYHAKLKLWFTRPSDQAMKQMGYERGSYIYFDINSWERRLFRDTNIPGGLQFMTEEELSSPA
jgi:CCR4-NOT transcription complex subunit 2